MRRRHLPVLAAFAALATGTGLRAQPAWPARPIRIIVTFPPGGSSDIVARVLAEVLSQRLPQRVLVENRPGAGGTLGAAYVATQPADGYTLLLSNTAPIVTSPPIYANVPYDPVTGFTHIAYLGATPLVIMVNPRLVPATDLAGLVAWIKAQATPPGFGSSGAGSVAHIFGEAFTQRTGAQLTHVPYRGSAPMQADLLGGAIPLAFDTLPQNVENIRAGRLRAIAITAPARQEMAPEVPTTAEGGFPGLVAENWLGLAGPPGLPAPVVATLHREVAAALENPLMKSRILEHGIAVRPMTQPEFTTYVAEEVRVVGGAVKALGLTAQ
ncbi:Bug family tripartite tricarboxylate transporter substrate binding protein [Falsiroseomonas tokyonensis]|uniref:Bug family tripartite tricarboxylate transporter substrate binding protein n=1 Tax=Falsiroseomonas tokyonensis TaxID=430521 RepID=A0ABV7BZ21_9PROT|nr:tripartite tricarboxylate transporter substrate binding protein [Falsiroseomonas tokyonensis]MBU8539904.1 tripartite tricarboxylate transporter substrate binding protein [Falsiroseomonas tokyonensis]